MTLCDTNRANGYFHVILLLIFGTVPHVNIAVGYSLVADVCVRLAAHNAVHFYVVVMVNESR